MDADDFVRLEGKVDHLLERVQSLEDYVRHQKGFIAGIVSVFVVLGFALQSAIFWWSGKQ